MRRDIQVVSRNNVGNPLLGVETELYKTSDYSFEEPVASGLSDVTGVVLFTQIEPAVYRVLRRVAGWYFDTQGIEVLNIDSQTYSTNGWEFHPDSPPDRKFCIVYGNVREITDKQTTEPNLQVRLVSKGIVYIKTGEEVMAYPQTVSIDDDGAWSIALVPNALMRPESRYLFTFTWRDDKVNPDIYTYKKKGVVPNRDEIRFDQLPEYLVIGTTMTVAMRVKACIA